MGNNLQSRSAYTPLRLLVVEDSGFLRQVFRAAFRDEYLVETAATAKEGWRLFLDKNPDIVFLDIILPDESGLDLARRIKAHSPAAYVVMTTVSDDDEDREEAAFNHADGFITKPFDKQKIESVIGKYRVLSRNA